MLRRIAPGLFVLTACSSAEPIHPPDEHEEMPEAIAPITRDVEGGPIVEGFFESPDVPLTVDVVTVSPVSRAAVWITMATDGPAPKIEAQPGWANGQKGPWITLSEVWSEGRQRILAADLETAATTLSLRLEANDAVTSFWWTANVPLAEAARSTQLPELRSPLAGVAPRVDWGAAAARCGVSDEAITKVTLVPVPATAVEITTYLRAAQAFDQEGRHLCDQRANYVLGDAPSVGRGARRPAYFLGGSDQGRITIATLGCDVAPPRLAELLGALTREHHLTGPEQFEIGSSPVCKGPSPSLAMALESWLGTRPFDLEPEPEPNDDATISGKVWDSDTGDETSGAALAGVSVSCDCGRSASTDANGHFAIVLPVGPHQLTFAKMGYDAQSRSLTVVPRVDASLSLGLAPTTQPNPGVSVIDHSFLIGHFGGNDVDPLGFPETQDGFQAYLDAVGVDHFAAWEYVVPNNPQVAADCGYTILLPERAWWPKAGALGLLADQLRDLVNEPVELRNWWRPQCYNAGVGGAAGGDHPDADAVDLDFRSERSRADAQRLLCETYWKRDLIAPEDIAPGSNLDPRLNLSVGLGGVTIHLGLLSSNGRRFWKYDSYSALSGSGDCW